jgi:hypothetical protein
LTLACTVQARATARQEVAAPSGAHLKEIIFRPLPSWGPYPEYFPHHLATAAAVYEYVYNRAADRSAGGTWGKAKEPAVKGAWAVARDELLLLKKMRFVSRLGSRSLGDLQVPAGELVAQRQAGRR